jgi:DNA polymerase III epsilon subunit-like protein
MTDNEYLFFDIECANCFGGEGKICSFGYVICDERFNIIECDDLVMNPESKFDWAFFSKKIDVSLSYPKQKFLSSPKFPHYYPKIYQLMTEHSGRIIGFAPKNDIGFLDYTCRRYETELPRTQIYDLVSILHTKVDEDMKLVKWAQRFDVNMSKLTAHNSADDAKMTMFVLRGFCAEYRLSLAEAIKAAERTVIDTGRYLSQKKQSRAAKEYRMKIKQLSKVRHIIKEDKLHGQHYHITLPKNADMKAKYELAMQICAFGGELDQKIRKNVTVVVDDDRVKQILASEIAGFCQNIISVSELRKQIL